MLEAYCAFGDYATMMETVESLITTVAQKVLGTEIIQHEQRASFATVLDKVIQRLEDLGGDLGKLAMQTSSNLNATDLVRIRQDLVKIQSRVVGSESLRKLSEEAIKALNEYSLSFDPVRDSQGQNLSAWNDQARADMAKFQESYSWLLRILAPFATTKQINLSRPWKRIRYKDIVREKAGADWFDVSPAERRQRAHDMGAEIGKEFEDFEVTNAVFSKFIEPTLIQPTFVTHLPKELVPLAKLSPDDPTTVEVFECCINGQEISPGYTEQNDPIAQRATLEHQAGGEQQKLDEDFLVALEHGMPPAGGIGIGIDRLCMMLLGQESIRDVILFPQLKPK
jgi:lysyl-tRNA synthetase class II